MADTTPSAETHLITAIPFPGFYNSMLDLDIDSAEEYETSSLANRDREEVPDELCLDEGEYKELIIDCANYVEMHKAIAKEYVEQYGNVVAEQCNYRLNLEYEKMISPKEYNFTTDRVFAYIPKSVVWDIFSKVNHASLAALIKDRFTSFSGFASFYSNDIADWLEKPVLEWDHNELETLICAFLNDRGLARGDTCHTVSSRIEFSTFIDNHIDWPKLEAKVAEKRDEKRAQYPEGHVFKDKPCKHTADMFGGSHA